MSGQSAVSRCFGTTRIIAAVRLRETIPQAAQAASCLNPRSSLIVITWVVNVRIVRESPAKQLVAITPLLIGEFAMTAWDREIKSAELLPEVARYVDARMAEFGAIPAERRAQLERVSEYIRDCQSEGRPARLTFVCTHNSRRSHFGQIWAQIAAARDGLAQVETFSGGTEATALNPRSVDALRRCGLRITADDPTAANPRYRVSFSVDSEPLICFSKVFDAPPNPTNRFCAVMTCSEADESCPTVPGCDLRIAITYEDPKSADDSPQESATYDRRCRQIAREMLYLISCVTRRTGFQPV
jgi:arsenate reductase (thioredoxin)